ncbi:DNRLRE domain-containing protein [Candidatus Dojkabacteria bacterium]|uniref:DNRLRE domain-containing protein n=1 Tax=Candidatus Dojkabacteria bacterium TaxID=2099670 RepID=A0A955L536_9BACT|nr:DNRLRE domain-containing protein [Candidatus Dojkabacteria bacterium]
MKTRITAILLFTLVVSIWIPITPVEASSCGSHTDNGNGTCTAILKPGPEGLDAQIDQSFPTTNYGTKSTTYLGTRSPSAYPGGPYRGLLKFDLSSINGNVLDADLSIWEYQYDNYDNYGYFYRVTSDWDENTVTWNTQPSYNGTLITSFLFTTYRNYTKTTKDITPIVTDWVDGTYPNYGFYIRGSNEGAWTRVWFPSSDNATAAYRPELVITYEPSVGVGMINVSVNVSNVAPIFKSGTDVYEDPTSDSTSPTDEGTSVTFKATAEDANEDNYFLIICSSNAVTAEGGTGNAPSCDATEYCVSSSTTAASGSEVEASCSYTTTGAEAESNDWYAFVCDDVTGSICSSASQGTLVDGSESPFKVNHDPTFTALNVDGADDPGGDVVFTATASDSDTDGTSDIVQMFVCDNSGATSSGCNGTEYCSSTSVASNPSCTYNYPSVVEDGNYTVYGHVFDSHGLASASNPQTVDYTVNNVAPVVSNVIVNGSSDITLTENTTTSVDITATVTDNNSCEDLVTVESSLYRSTITYSGCDLDAEDDDDSCYAQVTCTVDSGTCSNNTDAIATYTCTVAVQFHADPTAANTEYPAENWLATVNAVDSALSDNTESAAGVEMNALVALDITETSISYGAVNAGGDTGATNQIVEVTATGNVGLDTDLNGNGDGMCISSFASPSCPAAKVDLNYQEYAAAGFTYGSGTDLSGTATELELNVPKTIDTGSIVIGAADTYWGIGLPGVITTGSYYGETIITAVLGETAGW